MLTFYFLLYDFCCKRKNAGENCLFIWNFIFHGGVKIQFTSGSIMMNFFDKYVVYLDPETLKYMFLNYTGTRKYPVMTKLFNLLRESYINNQAVTPISYEHIQQFISDKKIDTDFLNMMGEIGQVKFHQRFT